MTYFLQFLLMNAETALTKNTWPFFSYVRFDDKTQKFSVHEDFVKCLNCARMSGKALFEILMDYMVKKGITMKNG